MGNHQFEGENYGKYIEIPHWYPVALTDIATEHGPFIVNLPIKIVIVQGFLYVNQRVLVVSNVVVL